MRGYLAEDGKLDISNKSACLFALFLNFGCYALNALGFKVAGLPILVFSIMGIIFVFIKNFQDSRKNKLKERSGSEVTVLPKQMRIPKNLPDAQENILKYLATLSSNERLKTDEIAEYIRLSPQKTQLLLDQLVDKRLVVKPGDSYVPDLFPKKYSLDDGGRIYLNNKGLLR